MCICYILYQYELFSVQTANYDYQASSIHSLYGEKMVQTMCDLKHFLENVITIDCPQIQTENH